MQAGWERRKAPDNSDSENGKRWGRRCSRPGFPNVFARRRTGTRGRSAGVQGGEQESCALVSSSVGRA